MNLLQLDEALFRAIHVGLRRDWLDPFIQSFSDSGLFHVQGAALLVAALRRKIPLWWTIALIVVSTVVLGLIERGIITSAAFLGCTALFWMVPGRAAAGAIYSAAAAGVLRLGIVKPIGRLRPSNLQFSSPMEPIYGATSFPSGHMTTSFAIAVWLLWALRGTEYYFVAQMAVIWALLVGFARIYGGVHYPLDVIGGMALGATTATLMWLLFDHKGWTDQTVSQIPIERNLS